MQYLSSERHQNEIDMLIERFGTPAISHVAVCTDAFWSTYVRERKSEVCMVIRRPNGSLLTFTKAFYLPDLYRLFTGGVEPSERIYDALLREIHEETNLQVEIRRLLAIATYYAEDIETGVDGPTRFTTFAFLLDEIGGVLQANDEHEQVVGYREILPEALPSIADQLDHLPQQYAKEFEVNWYDWGRYRAVIHRLVWYALRDASE